MDDVDERREIIFEIIDNQLEANDLPEVNQTYQRLKKQGYSDFNTKQLIGQCLAVEIHDSLQKKQEFDQERYIENLKNLPEEPFEE